VDAVEEALVTGAQVVQPGFAIRGLDEAVFGTFAMASKTHIAVQAVLRQVFAFIQPEPGLVLGADHLQHVLLPDVAQQVIRLDEVVTGIQVAIVLECQAVTASLIENTHARRTHPHPVAGGRLEGLHKHFAHVILDPLIEDLDQEAAKLLWTHRAVGDCVAYIVDVVAIRVDALDDRDELDPAGADFITQELIYLPGMVAGDPVYGDQDVVLHLVLLQQPQSTHNLIKGALVTLVDAVGIVEALGPIQAEANQEIVLLEELAPLIVQEGAVGLHGVFEGHSRFAVFLLVFDRLAEKIYPHKGWFAALPGHRDLGAAVGLDQLLDIYLENLFRHAEVATRVKQLLV